MTSQIGGSVQGNVDMTVRGKSAGVSIQGKADRDILFKILLQKPTTGVRRELVHSTSSSFPSHISRKLLLEEHKLDIQLEKIEKERKLFLNRNSNERHMLQLSMRTGKTSENGRGSGQCLVLNDNSKCHSSSSDHGNLKEGNGMMRKSWTSTTNGVFYESGAKSVRQLQVKKVCLLKKMAERHRMTNSLPWKRNFDTPQVPPPSRSPSKTNIIWVRVRNSSGEMEIDGFLRTNKDIEGLLPPEGVKDNIVPTKIELRLPREQDMAHKDSVVSEDKNISKIDDLKLNTDTNRVLEKPNEENCSVMKNVDIDIAQSLKQRMIEQESLRTRLASSIHTEVLIDQLVPMVKGLKVSPNEIRRSGAGKQKSEDEVYENSKYSRTENDRTFMFNGSSYVLKDNVMTAIPCLESKSDASGWTNSGSDRKNIAGNSVNIESNRSNVERGQQKIGSDRKKIECSRKKIGSAPSNTGSDRSNIGSGRKRIGSSRKSMGKIVRKNIANNRKNIGKDKEDVGSERKTPNGGKNANEGKTNRHAKNSQGSGKSSSTKINKGKNAQKFVRTKPNVQGMCVFAKTFIIKSKGKTGWKTQENEKGLSKPRSATHLNDKKSATKLPKKSCSACAVKTSLKDDSLRVATRDIRSKSDTTAYSKVRAALQISGVSSPEKPHSAAAIMIPSQSQLQNFDKVAKIKLRQTLAVKMRRHCYTGRWAFPPGQIRESEMEEKE